MPARGVNKLHSLAMGASFWARWAPQPAGPADAPDALAGGPPAAEECSLGSQGNSSGISETCADDGLHEQTSLPVLTQACFPFDIVSVADVCRLKLVNGLACHDVGQHRRLNRLSRLQEDGDPPAALLSEEDTPLGEGKPAHDAALTNSYPNLDAEAADKLENAMKSLQPIPGLLEPASPPPRQRGVYVLSAYSAHAPVRRPPQGQPALGDGISSSTLLRRQAMGKVAPFPAAGGGRKRAAASRKPLAAAAVPQKRQRVEAVPAGSHGPPAGPTFTSWQRTDAPLTRSRTMCNGSDAPATSP